ncbi:hypothetical protein [Roseiconus lacunae]|uniref:Uncharacterized protein n=1 Tax=Roseiconus lacunae TaxID=2605694 RepID=A0ABT7PFX9_9BACT|nr:hypothetical protein [Roseiconus lacunae]MDM4015403.1 hypothetical protein [Roseiconus lacunae]
MNGNQSVWLVNGQSFVSYFDLIGEIVSLSLFEATWVSAGRSSSYAAKRPLIAALAHVLHIDPGWVEESGVSLRPTSLNRRTRESLSTGSLSFDHANTSMKKGRIMTTDTNTNPQIEAQLDSLATHCCDVLLGEESLADDRCDQLLRSLLMSGYRNKDGRSIQVELDERVKEKCGERAMHRGGELSSITSKVEKRFTEIARWESKSPKDDTDDTKPANISSATDA